MEPFAYLGDGDLLRRLDREMASAGYGRIVASACLDGGVEVIDSLARGFAQPRPGLALAYEPREMLNDIGPAMFVAADRLGRQSIRDLL